MKKINFEPAFRPNSSARLDSFLPQPKSSLGSAFGGFMRGALGSAAGALTGGGSNILLGLDSQYEQLLTLQMEMNALSQRTNLQSNVEKARHDTKMAPIRNIRVN